MIQGMRSPLPENASREQHLLWRLANEHTRAIATNTSPRVSAEDRHNLMRPSTLRNFGTDMHNIIDGLQRVVPPPSSRTLAGYMTGMQSVSHLVRAYNLQQGQPDQIRQTITSLLSLYRDAPIWVGEPSSNWAGQGVQIIQQDLNTLIIDPLNDGWLSESMINSLLMMMIHQQFHLNASLGILGHDYYMLHSTQFSAFRRATGSNRNQVPIAHPAEPRRLVLPVHWGNHWGVMTYNPDTHTMQYWDSHPNPQARQANLNTAYETFQNLLSIYQDEMVQPQFRGQAPTRGPWSSDVQGNSYDCGVFVVENARRFIEDTGDHPERRAPITTALRAFLIQELQLYLTQVQDQSEEALNANRRRHRERQQGRGGQSHKNPYELSPSMTPPPP